MLIRKLSSIIPVFIASLFRENNINVILKNRNNEEIIMFFKRDLNWSKNGA